MFGLSTREVLTKVILNSVKNNIGIYKQSIIDNISNIKSNPELENTVLFQSIRQEYLDHVSNDVFNSFKLSSPSIAARIQLTLMSPSLCGYDDINFENGILAGSIYAICYYSMNNKVAAPKDCINLNHIHNDIMEQALSELDKELL
ncbi:hypothetical protein SDC9_121034 [bioreactor metagenome]|uniref:Uncharacterized protein n=1 Tax=bioreactor metagenome TaxID=1076179 RepID=A0A645CAU1_9ZZZZ